MLVREAVNPDGCSCAASESIHDCAFIERLSCELYVPRKTSRSRPAPASWIERWQIYAVIAAMVVVWCFSTRQSSAATFMISMNAWDHIASVEIVEAEDDDEGNIPVSCDRGKNVFGPARMDKGFGKRYVSKVTSSSPLCWRRNADPQNDASRITKWYICEATTNTEIINCDIQ
jgi:hypothetical protein